MKRWIMAIFAIGLMLGAASAPAAAQQLAAGESEIAEGAVAYRPASLSPGPRPLIVLLHGAGGYPPNFLQSMKPIADQRGILLLAPHSTRATWDLIDNIRYGLGAALGNDAERIDRSLSDLLKHAQVDRSRVVLVGFSDGATFALALGLSNPKQYKSVLALSPGFLVSPEKIDRRQKVFIAHGRDDQILPFSNGSGIADDLRKAGGNVRFRPFDGRHQIDKSSLSEGLDWALDTAAR